MERKKNNFHEGVVKMRKNQTSKERVWKRKQEANEIEPIGAWQIWNSN